MDGDGYMRSPTRGEVAAARTMGRNVFYDEWARPRMTAKEMSEAWAELGSLPGSLASEAADALREAVRWETQAEKATANGANDAARVFHREADKSASVAFQALASCVSRLRTLEAACRA